MAKTTAGLPLSVAVVAAVVSVSAATLVTAASQNGDAEIARLNWLHGCWLSESGTRTVDEQWMAPRGGAMLGMSRTVQDGTLREYELVVIRQTAGGLAYEAHPAGQPAATFPMKELGESSVLFENPQHDFPQRIGYRRDARDRLTAWIEGTSGGRTRRVEFPYRRAACAS